MADDPIIREIRSEDADAVAVLSGELGYPAAAEQMRRRIETLSALPNHVLYAACIGGQVVGWIHVAAAHHLQEDPRAEIEGLVVSAVIRSHGIGRLLVAAGEQWARAHKFNRIGVRSRLQRESAHRFYLREGYVRSKTSAVFTKELP